MQRCGINVKEREGGVGAMKIVCWPRSGEAASAYNLSPGHNCLVELLSINARSEFLSEFHTAPSVVCKDQINS